MPPASHNQHMFSLILLLLIHQCSHFTFVKCANIDGNYGKTTFDATSIVSLAANDTTIALTTPANAPLTGNDNSRAIQYHATLDAENKKKIRRSRSTSNEARLFGPTFVNIGNLLFRGLNFFQPELLSAGCAVTYLAKTYPSLARYSDLQTWVQYAFGKFRDWRKHWQKLRNKIDYSLDDAIVDYKLKKLTTEDYEGHLKELQSLETDDEAGDEPVRLIDLEESGADHKLRKRRRRTLFKTDWDVKLEAHLLAMVDHYQKTFASDKFLSCVQLYVITAALRFISGFFV